MDDQACVRCGAKIGDREPFVNIQFITHFYTDPDEIENNQKVESVIDTVEIAHGDGNYCADCMKEISDFIMKKPPVKSMIRRTPRDPCKPGDTVYKLTAGEKGWHIEKRTVRDVSVCRIVRNDETDFRDYFHIAHETGTDTLGEEVFLKLEEAQKAIQRKKKEEIMLQEIREQPISELGFSHRTYNCLKRAGMQTIGELLDASTESLCLVRGLGARAMEEITRKKKEIYSRRRI